MSALFCGRRVVKIRCDNGGEYSSKLFKDFCSSKGIQISYTPPYSPQMNGVTERKNQTLRNMARAMILQAGMEKTFWEEAVLTAAYITNRMQSCVIKEKTPYELWIGRKPNVSNMRIFGCVAYARVPDSLRTKLDDKAIKCRFVGYAENGYRLWSEEDGRIIHSRNVTFDERLSRMNKRNTDDSFEKEDEIEGGKFNKNEIDERKPDNNLTEIPTEINVEKENEVIDEFTSNDECRPKRNKKLPSHFDDYEIDFGCLALLSNSTDTPKSFKEAQKNPKWDKWKEAITEELKALEETETWELIEKPSDKEVISNRWVFKEKENGEGKVVYKARLVARGFEQENTDLSLIHAPVARLSTFRILMSICVNDELMFEQLDVKNAFLNGKMEERVFMAIPDGLKVDAEDKGKVCLLNKAIYGLK